GEARRLCRGAGRGAGQEGGAGISAAAGRRRAGQLCRHFGARGGGGLQARHPGEGGGETVRGVVSRVSRGGARVIAPFRELFAQLSPRRRRQFATVLLLMLAGAMAELVSLGAILPFLAVVANPDGASAGGVLCPVPCAPGLRTPRP